MTKILLLSDTHGHLDKTILKYVRMADEVWHAGDIGDLNISNFLNELKHTLPNVKAYRLMLQLFKENPGLNDIICNSGTIRQAKKKLKTWALDVLCENKEAYSYFIREKILSILVSGL